jgi:hypothetical protein
MFMSDLERRLSNRVPRTSDGHKAYLDAVEPAFGSDVDYSMMVKVFGSDRDQQVRHSPCVCIGTEVIKDQREP